MAYATEVFYAWLSVLWHVADLFGAFVGRGDSSFSSALVSVEPFIFVRRLGV